MVAPSCGLVASRKPFELRRGRKDLSTRFRHDDQQLLKIDRLFLDVTKVQKELMGWPSLWPVYNALALAIVPEQLALIISQLPHLGSSRTVQLSVVNIFQYTADDGQLHQAAGEAAPLVDAPASEVGGDRPTIKHIEQRRDVDT
jgi:hypothetical protein